LKTYEYKGFDRDGHVSKGLVEALSVKDAREKLADDGILTERLSVTGRKLRFPPASRAIFYRELSALLGAGLPLVRALELLIQSHEMMDSRMLLAGIRDAVREGSSLAGALSEASESITAFERVIIEAAEHSATVEPMLESLASFLEEQEKLKDRIHGALIYPTIVLTVGICVAVLMLGLLIPRARNMLADTGVPLPTLTRFMIGLGGVLMKWGVLFMVVVGSLLFYLRYRLRHDTEFRRDWNRRLFRVPLLGRGYGILVSLRFSRTLSILLRGGVSLIEGLILAGRATGSAWLGHLAEAEAESVRHGSSLSDAVRRIPPLSESLPGWIQVGEASGGLERLLDSAADRYQDQWDRFVGRCLSFFEPLLILLIGGFVLLVTLAVLLPVFSLSQTIGR